MSPGGIYKEQTGAPLRMKPSAVVWQVNAEANREPKAQPFHRVLRKLPENARPDPQGPSYGPMEQPNEAVWFEMNHRLHGILKKAGRRAERRKQRRIRSKLFRGRAGKFRKTDEGRDLRKYLDESF